MDHRRLAACRTLAAATAVIASCVPAATARADDPSETITLYAEVRDFKGQGESGGHPDFENQPDKGFGHYGNAVAYTIGEGDVPAYLGAARKITRQWKDLHDRPICPHLYDAERGDSKGKWGAASDAGITSEETFAQWFRDVPGVNLSASIPIRLQLQPDGSWLFDDRTDPDYEDLGGFFPIDDQLFGNTPGGPDHNYHFTLALHMQFTYHEADGLWFKFDGSDDVWVFVDDRVAVDIGGVHAAQDQHLDLDRMDLVDGETYTMRFFFAQRFRPRSNFRLHTNVLLWTPSLPTVTEAYD